MLSRYCLTKMGYMDQYIWGKLKPDDKTQIVKCMKAKKLLVRPRNFFLPGVSGSREITAQHMLPKM